uniref:Uncharacterized protein n=1 Tax=Tetranychus urticae TaxID=32264 RepID=T1KHW8_TETUR
MVDSYDLNCPQISVNSIIQSKRLHLAWQD